MSQNSLTNGLKNKLSKSTKRDKKKCFFYNKFFTFISKKLKNKNKVLKIHKRKIMIFLNI